MLTTARIREDLEPAGLDWISALKTVDIRRLLKEGAADGLPAHSLRTLLDNLATLMLNQMRLPGDSLNPDKTPVTLRQNCLSGQSSSG